MGNDSKSLLTHDDVTLLTGIESAATRVLVRNLINDLRHDLAEAAEAMKLPAAFTAMIVRMGEKAAAALGRHPDPQINRMRTSSTGDCEVTVEMLARDYRTVSAKLREVEALRDTKINNQRLKHGCDCHDSLDAILRPSTTTASEPCSGIAHMPRHFPHCPGICCRTEDHCEGCPTKAQRRRP